MEKKIIKFYRKDVYGQRLEYVCGSGDRAIIQKLTGQKTVNGVIRELLRDLSGGRIGFEEVAEPSEIERFQMEWLCAAAS